MDKLRSELKKALIWEDAHVGFARATENLNPKSLGNLVKGSPYTIWQLAEHIRFAQKDIVDFCVGNNYSEPKWPDDYWPQEQGPQSTEEWEQCLQRVKDDRQRMIDLVTDEQNNLFEPFPHGKGQHLFREALLIIDHEAYHTGQIVLIRKLLGKWD